MMVLALYSCNQKKKSTPDNVNVKAVISTKYVDTEYKYPDAAKTDLIIQNSMPKSGIHYTDPKGKKYVYAVFWTQITNKTNKTLEINIDFPVDSFEFPPSSGNYFKLLLPSDTITLQKRDLYDYGLKIKPFLDHNIHKASSLKRTINPNESSGFYVVPLSNRGTNSTLRTGFRLKGQNLYYRINNKEIPCGKINWKN